MYMNLERNSQKSYLQFDSMAGGVESRSRILDELEKTTSLDTREILNRRLDEVSDKMQLLILSEKAAAAVKKIGGSDVDRLEAMAAKFDIERRPQA